MEVQASLLHAGFPSLPHFIIMVTSRSYQQHLPPKPLLSHLFPPAPPWISARLLKGERKPLEIIVLDGLGVHLILCVSTASLYSQQSMLPLGLNTLSVSAELVLTYSSGSDGGVGVVTHAGRHFQSHTSKRKFTDEPPEAEQSL